MKVIAVNSGKYICEVSHTEIEKYMNLYYNDLKKLRVDEEIDLGKGYNFHKDTNRALKSTTEFIKAGSLSILLNELAERGYVSEVVISLLHMLDESILSALMNEIITGGEDCEVMMMKVDLDSEEGRQLGGLLQDLESSNQAEQWEAENGTDI